MVDMSTAVAMRLRMIEHDDLVDILVLIELRHVLKVVAFAVDHNARIVTRDEPGIDELIQRRGWNAAAEVLILQYGCELGDLCLAAAFVTVHAHVASALAQAWMDQHADHAVNHDRQNAYTDRNAVPSLDQAAFIGVVGGGRRNAQRHASKRVSGQCTAVEA